MQVIVRNPFIYHGERRHKGQTLDLSRQAALNLVALRKVRVTDTEEPALRLNGLTALFCDVCKEAAQGLPADRGALCVHQGVMLSTDHDGGTRLSFALMGDRDRATA